MLNKYLSLPIRIHFLVFVFLLAVPFLCIIIYVGIMEHKDALRDAQNECFAFVNIIAREEQILVTGIRQLATTIAILPEVTTRDGHRIDPLLKKILKDNPQYTNITISDEHGRILKSAMPFKDGMSVAHQKYFKDTVRTGMFSSGEYFIGRMTNKPIMIFGYPVKNAAGQLTAVIGIGIDFIGIRDVFEKLNLPAGSSFSLLDHKGTILYRHLQDNLSTRLMGSKDIKTDIFTKMQEGREEGTFTAEGNDGSWRIFAYKKMTLPHEAQPYLYIRSSIPQSSASDKASHRLFVALSVIGLLSFAGLFWAWFIGKRIIVDRVTALENASKQLAIGTHVAKVSHVVKGGDLGELAKAIDLMMETIAEKEVILRTVLEAVNDSLFMIDNNGTVLALNTTTAERFRKGPEEILGTNIYDLMPAQLAKARRSHQEVVMQSGKVERFEDEREGMWIESILYPVSIDNNICDRIVIFGRDITERKQAEEVLRKSEENYRQLFNNSPSAIYQIDFRTGKFLKANDVICEYLGCSQEEITLLSPYDFMTNTSKQLLSERLTKIGLGEKVADNPEYEIVDKNGKHRWIQLNSKNIFDTEGLVIGADVVAHEITDKKRADEERCRSQESAERLAGEMTVIAQIGRVVGSTLDLNQVFERVATETRKLIPFDRFLVNLKKTPDGQFIAAYVSGIDNPRRRVGDLYPSQGSATGVVMNTHTGILIQPTDAEEIKDLYPNLYETFKTGLRSTMSVPLISMDEVIGSMNFRSTKLKVYTEQDLRLAERIGMQVAGAIANAQLFEDLKETEKSLRKSEIRFRELAELLPETIFETDIQGTLTFANKHAFDCFGYTSGDFTGGLNLLDTVAPHDRGRALENAQRIMSGENIGSHEYTMQRKDGNTFPAIIRTTANVQDGKSVGLRGFVIDITERKRTEEIIRRSEEKFSKAFHSSPILTAISTIEDGRLIDVNELLLQTLLFSREEVIGKTSLELGFFANHAQRQVIRKVTEEKGYARNIEAQMVTKNGKIIDGLFSAEPITINNEKCWLTVMVDVTEQKRVEAALRESESQFRNYVENAPIGVFVCDEKGRYLQVNPAATTITGYTSEELLTMSIPDLLPPESQALAAQYFQIVAETGRVSAEFAFRHKHGKIGMWSLEGVRLSPTRFMGLVTDITGRKEAENEKVKLQDQLLQSQKMESVGRLAGGVAHDFNNMLGVILGHVEMAMEQVDPAQPIHADLTEILKAAGRSADLTRQLLAFARKQVVSPKVLDLNDTVAGMLKMLRRLIGEDIQLAWLPGANLWSIEMDPSQIDQILANLSVNARDAIAGVGKVTIETGNVTLDEVFYADHADFIPGEYVLLAVSDDGCGMDKEILGKLFEPFFTTKETGKGTGLGLAMVYGIVRQNSGFIDVCSEPNQGTTLKIYLPRHVGNAEQIQMDDLQEAVMCGRETVLVLEDEKALLDLSKRILEKQGYRVLATDTPSEAIRLALQYTGELHLLMTDVVMPEMNGRDLANKLISIHPNLKCLFTSGYTADVIAQHGVLDDNVHFIQKPFSRKDLAAKVRAVLDQK